MKLTATLQKLENKIGTRKGILHFYQIYPDDYEGPLPDGFCRERDVPKEFPPEDVVVRFYL